MRSRPALVPSALPERSQVEHGMTSLPTLRVCRANYADPVHAKALVSLLDVYARDPMGGGEPLSVFVRSNLVQALADRPQAFSVLAFDGASQNAEARAVGLVNCFEGFSTFACQPLVNVHDVAVVPEYRGQGVGTTWRRQSCPVAPPK